MQHLGKLNKMINKIITKLKIFFNRYVVEGEKTLKIIETLSHAHRIFDQHIRIISCDVFPNNLDTYKMSSKAYGIELQTNHKDYWKFKQIYESINK